MTHLVVEFPDGGKWAGTQNVRTRCLCDQEQSHGEEQNWQLEQKQTSTWVGNTILQCEGWVQRAYSISLLHTFLPGIDWQSHPSTEEHKHNEQLVRKVCLGETWTCLCPGATAKQVLVYVHTITHRNQEHLDTCDGLHSTVRLTAAVTNSRMKSDPQVEEGTPVP